jgi:hypothetical protein
VTAKMLVLYVKRTRHAVSALTVAAMPATPLTIDILINDALKLRLYPTDFDVPASELDVAPVDLNEEALIDPFRFSVGADLILQTLDSWSPTLVSSPFPTIVLTEPGPPSTTSDHLDALLMEQSGSDPAQTQGRTTTAGEASFQAILAHGTKLGFLAGYRVLVSHYP